MSRPELEDQSSGGRLGQPTYSVFMLRIARRDMMASVTAFLNCLKGEFQWKLGKEGEGPNRGEGCGRARLSWAHLMARYIGRMANRGKVCTLIMMVMKAR